MGNTISTIGNGMVQTVKEIPGYVKEQFTPGPPSPNVVFALENNSKEYDIRFANVKLPSGYFHDPPHNNFDSVVSVDHIQDFANRTRAFSTTAYWVAASYWTLHGGLLTGIEGSMDLMACRDGTEKKIGEMSWNWNNIRKITTAKSTDDGWEVKEMQPLINQDWRVIVRQK
ncbi:hypothetical protein DPSP01_004935 [Paraphaeosphaeria sporulosa]|uniref:Uncharacterized protein n=1 Tax=Paraphaeosphaeria sporulosa TaxID=1460663 RepID=A0A177C813_9PLEO|nr:uncharacterized protein CC84DRAFT_1166989 [Paraphaeosphaeria sporulosa]OAG03271.1 hypothetical protein CC84DRAFT_1166989 [Paraphaeosphaeria sporulosa]